MKFLKLLLLVCGLTVQMLSVSVCRGEEESIQEMLAVAPVQLKGTLLERIVGQTVVEMLTFEHYQNYSMNPEMSSRWFHEYFKTLDYARIYFLESDLEEFRSYESVLWDYRSRSVNVEFAFAVYRRFLERVQQWAVFCVKYLENPPKDFDKAESILLDEDKVPWCRTSGELQQRWEKRCRNSLLANILQEEREEKDKKNNEKKKQDRTRRSAEEEILEFDHRGIYKIKRYILTVPEKKKENPAAAAKQEKITAPVIKRPETKKDPFPVKLAKNIARNYKRRTEFTNMEILEIYLSSLCRLFDPHTAYMAPDTKDNFDINMSLSLQGIGATLSTRGAYVIVVNVIPGGPADLDGRLKEGDRIVAVTQDGKEPVDVVDMSLTKVVAQIRGAKGTVVHLTVLPEGSNTEKTISIRRDEVKLQNQEAQGETWTIPAAGALKSRRCLTIYLPSFYSDFGARSRGRRDYKSSSRDVARLIEMARRDGPVDALVLDLRGNGGGSLPEAVELAGLFLTGGPVVQVRSYNGHIVSYGDPSPVAMYAGPLVLLVDKFSASASEIVSSCLQDAGRAVIIGERSTHGKGTVQNLRDLSQTRRFVQARMLLGGKEPGSLKYTTAKYYRINGGSTQEKGVIPDIVLPAFTDHMELGESKLPNVLPWDEIPTSRYRRYSFSRENLPEFRKLFTQSLNRNPLYKELLKDIEYFAAFRKIKELPIDRKRRVEYQKKEEVAGKMLQKFQALRKLTAKPARKEGEKSPDQEVEPQDLMMDTTVDVLMEWLANQNSSKIQKVQ